MAVRTVLVDDLDGSEGAQTRTFSLFDIEYEIDLTEKNAAKLEKALEPYIKVARQVRSRRAPSKKITQRPAHTIPRPDGLNTIREWARKQGFDVPDRGRVRREIVEQYEAAHGGLGPATRK